MFNHPANPGWEELSVTAAGNGFDGDAECLARLGQTLAPVAEITQGRALEPLTDKLAQHRHDAFRIMHVGWRNVDRQRDAVLFDTEMNLTPRIFLPPSKLRSKQLGAERHDLLADSRPLADGERRLSITTAVGSAVSPQASRQVRRSRSSSRRHSPSRVQRAKSVYSVPNGMLHSWPIARHCMPQKQTHQIAMMAWRSAAPANGGFGPDRVGRVPAIAASSASTASAKASTSLKASHEAGEVLAVLTAVPICCGADGCWRWPQT